MADSLASFIPSYYAIQEMASTEEEQAHLIKRAEADAKKDMEEYYGEVLPYDTFEGEGIEESSVPTGC